MSSERARVTVGVRDHVHNHEKNVLGIRPQPITATGKGDARVLRKRQDKKMLVPSVFGHPRLVYDLSIAADSFYSTRDFMEAMEEVKLVMDGLKDDCVTGVGLCAHRQNSGDFAVVDVWFEYVFVWDEDEKQAIITDARKMKGTWLEKFRGMTRARSRHTPDSNDPPDYITVHVPLIHMSGANVFVYMVHERTSCIPDQYYDFALSTVRFLYINPNPFVPPGEDIDAYGAQMPVMNMFLETLLEGYGAAMGFTFFAPPGSKPGAVATSALVLSRKNEVAQVFHFTENLKDAGAVWQFSITDIAASLSYRSNTNSSSTSAAGTPTVSPSNSARSSRKKSNRE